MTKKTRRAIVVLSILALVGISGAGTYWIVKKGLRRENAHQKARRFFGQQEFDRAAELAREVLVTAPNNENAQELLLESLGVACIVRILPGDKISSSKVESDVQALG